MYVVAAVGERAGPPDIPQVRQRNVGTVQPVGAEHAVAKIAVAGEATTALCGADVSGWIIFHQIPFTAERSGGCQRCGQLVAAPPSAPRR